MRRSLPLLFGAVFGLLVGAPVAREQTSTAPATPKPAASGPARSTSTYLPQATVQDLMAGVIDPASKVVFGAVSSETTATGVVETAPRNDAEWSLVRRNALMMVEGANLLLMPGRHIAAAERANVSNEGELSPAKIEPLVARNRAAWDRLAVDFRGAALQAVKAAEGRKTEDFNAVGEAIDAACESCHLRFWYPDQEQLLKNAPRAR